MKNRKTPPRLVTQFGLSVSAPNFRANGETGLPFDARGYLPAVIVLELRRQSEMLIRAPRTQHPLLVSQRGCWRIPPLLLSLGGGSMPFSARSVDASLP